jgi:hypothetical protein
MIKQMCGVLSKGAVIFKTINIQIFLKIYTLYLPK